MVLAPPSKTQINSGVIRISSFTFLFYGACIDSTPLQIPMMDSLLLLAWLMMGDPLYPGRTYILWNAFPLSPLTSTILPGLATPTGLAACYSPFKAIRSSGWIPFTLSFSLSKAQSYFAASLELTLYLFGQQQSSTSIAFYFSKT